MHVYAPYINICTHIYIYISYVYVCIPTYIHAYSTDKPSDSFIYMYIYICMHVRVYICIHLHVYIMLVFNYVCMFDRVYRQALYSYGSLVASIPNCECKASSKISSGSSVSEVSSAYGTMFIYIYIYVDM